MVNLSKISFASRLEARLFNSLKQNLSDSALSVAQSISESIEAEDLNLSSLLEFNNRITNLVLYLNRQAVDIKDARWALRRRDREFEQSFPSNPKQCIDPVRFVSYLICGATPMLTVDELISDIAAVFEAADTQSESPVEEPISAEDENEPTSSISTFSEGEEGQPVGETESPVTDLPEDEELPVSEESSTEGEAEPPIGEGEETSVEVEPPVGEGEEPPIEVELPAEEEPLPNEETPSGASTLEIVEEAVYRVLSELGASGIKGDMLILDVKEKFISK